MEKTADEKTTLVEEFDSEGRLARASCGTSISMPIGRGECRYRTFSGELRTLDDAESTHYEYGDGGQRLRESNFRAGKREGVTRTWHPNGQLASEVTYANGRRVAAREWDRDGKLERDEEYLPDGSRRLR